MDSDCTVSCKSIWLDSDSRLFGFRRCFRRGTYCFFRWYLESPLRCGLLLGCPSRSLSLGDSSSRCCAHVTATRMLWRRCDSCAALGHGVQPFECSNRLFQTVSFVLQLFKNVRGIHDNLPKDLDNNPHMLLHRREAINSIAWQNAQRGRIQLCRFRCDQT